jgi:ATP-binding cassette subfamily B protein
MVSEATHATGAAQNRRDMPQADERPRQRGLRPLLRLVPYLSRYRRQIVGAVVALVVAAGTVLALGQGLQLLIDRGFRQGEAAFLDQALLVLLGVVVVLAISSFARYYLVSWIGERVVADLRQDVYGRVIALEPGFFETTRTAEIVTRLTTDTTVLQVVVGSSVSVFLRNLLMFIGGGAMLMITSLKLTGLVALVIPLALVPILVFGRRVRRLSRATQERIADVGAAIDESLYGIRTVQAFGHEAREARRFGDRVEAAFNAAVDRVRARAFLSATVILLVFTAVATVLWIGGHDVLDGTLSPGALSAFVFYAILVAASAGALSEVYAEIQRAAGATERLFELRDTIPRIAAPDRALTIPAERAGRVAFEAVRFAYPSRPERWALDGVSCTVEPGESVAIVGPSGAGKTTLFHLLLRFYDPQEGGVRIGGVDIRQTDPSQLRRLIATVPQEPVIFSTSVAENIRYGDPEADDAAVARAADAAHARDFVEALPQGFDTHVGERGVRLSGGQRQRLALARAFLRDPAILLLDEATSALDAASERAVQEAFEAMMGDRTVMVIAHRLATVQRVDRILVLDQGRIVEQGDHASLVARGGLYARLAALQFDQPSSAGSGIAASF